MPARSHLHCTRGPAAFGLLVTLVALGCADGGPPPSEPRAPFPIPAFVSPEARAVLSRPIDLRAANAPAPLTDEEWHARREATESAFMRPFFERALAATSVQIEEAEIGGVPVRVLTPPKPRLPHAGIALIGLHGGGYTIGGGDLSAMEGLGLAAAGYRVVSVDYRMPPDHPFPAAVEDGVAVYRELLDSYAPERVAFFGTSAGGGLTASVIVSARDQGLPLPGAALMHTPWSDLSKTGDTYFTLEGVDPILSTYDGGLAQGAELYAGEAGLTHPLVSPVYADFEPGFPPALLSSGTRDLLLSCTVRLHRALREAGVDADLHVFDAMWHGAGDMPDMRDLQREVLAFLAEHVGP
ncbi:MAG: alpha/beta hydrolase [Myxococcota bacterium]